MNRPTAAGWTMRASVIVAAAACLLLVSPTVFSEPEPAEPTFLRGVVKDPVDDTPLTGARVRVGPRVTRTDRNGRFEIRVGRRRTGNLKTRFRMPGYLRYDTWTVAGTDTARTVYLFPDHPVRLDEHEGLVAPELLQEQFQLIFRDIYRTDEPAWLVRWREPPRIVVHTRLMTLVGPGRYMAGRKIPGRVRRHVRRVLEASIGPLSGGAFDTARIRFRRTRKGELFVRDIRDHYRRGEIRIFFQDEPGRPNWAGIFLEADRFLESGGEWIRTRFLSKCLESDSLSGCLEIVSAEIVLQLRGLESQIERGSGATVRHEFAHTLGMKHPDRQIHGTDVLPLCSSMRLQYCDFWDEREEAVPHVDRVMARLAYSRAPGNHAPDADPEPVPVEALAGLRGR